jgi:hypothetical protein
MASPNVMAPTAAKLALPSLSEDVEAFGVFVAGDGVHSAASLIAFPANRLMQQYQRGLGVSAYRFLKR